MYFGLQVVLHERSGSVWRMRARLRGRLSSAADSALRWTGSQHTEHQAGKFSRARSRLYRSRFMQPNIRWKALAEINTMHCTAWIQSGNHEKRTPLHRSQISVFFQNHQKNQKNIFQSLQNRPPSGAKVSASCRSRKILQNEYLVVKIGVDIADNAPSKVNTVIQFSLIFIHPGDLIVTELSRPLPQTCVLFSICSCHPPLKTHHRPTSGKSI